MAAKSFWTATGTADSQSTWAVPKLTLTHAPSDSWRTSLKAWPVSGLSGL